MKKWFSALFEKIKQQVETMLYNKKVKCAVKDFKKQVDEMMNNVNQNIDIIHCRTVVEFRWWYNLVEQLYNSKDNQHDLLIELKEMFKDFVLDKSDPQSIAGYGFKIVLEIVLEKHDIKI